MLRGACKYTKTHTNTHALTRTDLQLLNSCIHTHRNTETRVSVCVGIRRPSTFDLGFAFISGALWALEASPKATVRTAATEGRPSAPAKWLWRGEEERERAEKYHKSNQKGCVSCCERRESGQQGPGNSPHAPPEPPRKALTASLPAASLLRQDTRAPGPLSPFAVLGYWTKNPFVVHIRVLKIPYCLTTCGVHHDVVLCGDPDHTSARLGFPRGYWVP